MFDFIKRKPAEIKASATGRIAAQVMPSGRVAWSARDTVSLSRLGFLGNPMGFRAVKLISEAAAALPLVLHAAEAGEIAQRWMAEARISRVTARFALPKSRLDLGAGDRVQIGGQVYRIDGTLQGEYQLIEAVRSETALYRPAVIAEIPRPWTAPIADVPVAVRFLDLPLLTGDEVAHAPYACAVAKP